MIPSDVIGWFFLSKSQHSAKLILPTNLHYIPPADSRNRRRRAELRNTNKAITGISNDLVPKTARYPEKARVVVRGREKGKERQLPSRAELRGSNRPMATRKNKAVGRKRYIISKAERSNLGE